MHEPPFLQGFPAHLPARKLKIFCSLEMGNNYQILKSLRCYSCHPHFFTLKLVLKID